MAIRFLLSIETAELLASVVYIDDVNCLLRCSQGNRKCAGSGCIQRSTIWTTKNERKNKKVSRLKYAPEVSTKSFLNDMKVGTFLRQNGRAQLLPKLVQTIFSPWIPYATLF